MRTTATAAPTVRHVLVLEDNPSEARLAREWLVETGEFDVQVARTLAEALDALAGSSGFDAITVDLGLPDSVGLATFERVRAAAPDAAVVIVTGFKDEAAAVDAVHHGAQDYLIKDAAMGQVLPRAVRYAVERQRLVFERLQMEAALKQSERLEALGTLAGGIAHDFNNLLTAIIGYYELVKEAIADREGASADLEEIGKAAKIAASLTKQLLAFARVQPVDCVVLDLNRLILEFRRTLVSLLGDRITVDIDLSDEPLAIEADAGQCHQVLLNLAANARDAIRGQGRFRIQTRGVSDATGRAVVRVTVTDTGCGMDEQTRARMFEPFFTTKGLGHGTGLGLSTVHGIVHSAGGAISVESEPNRGTTITIDLPRSEKPVADAELEPAAPAKVRPLVFVVEDEQPIRALMAKSLARADCDVVAASSGAEALALASTVSRDVVLVLCDIVLPDARAQDIVPALRQLWPACCVVLTSGYSDSEAARDLPVDGFLPKPFAPDDVRTMVRRVLGAIS